MSSGVQRTMQGSFMGTTAELTIATVGFRPRSVKLFNQTSYIQLEWQESMPDASGKKQLANGATSFVTTNGITPTATGFILGTDSVNTAAVIHYEARE